MTPGTMIDRLLSSLIVLASFAMPMAAAADTRLSVAAMNGNMARVQELLDESVAVDAPQGDGSTALHWAARRDDLEMAEVLVQAGADPNAKTRLGDITPLYLASRAGSAAMIGLLLEAGADVGDSTANGTTSLMMAAASGSADAAAVLLEHGASVDARDAYQGQTALMFAAALNRASVIEVLAAHGADLDAFSLVPDAREKNAPAADQNRRRRARDADVLPLGGMAALHFAARDGQISAVEALVSAGADVNATTASDRTTPLTIAIMNGHLDLAQYLLDQGADPRPASTDGITALYMLVDARWAGKSWYPPPSLEQEMTGYLDLMRELLDRGANPNARLGEKPWFRRFDDWLDHAGATAFWRAAQANDLAAMKLLVAQGADPNIPTSHLVTPLHVAAGFGLEPQISKFVPGARLATTRYLVEGLDADVNAKDARGYTPLHGAALTGNNELILYLVHQGADVKARANQFFGLGTGPDEPVASGTGDSVADMANGPRERSVVYPETVSLLVKLGSENSDYCRAATCVIETRSDPGKPRGN